MAVIKVSEKKNLLDPNSVTFDERKEELEKFDEQEQKKRDRDKHSVFSRWTQFNLEHTQKLMWLTLNFPKAHAILYFLVDQMDNYNAVMCSYKVLEEVLEVGQATIARNIKVLKERGFIAVLKSGTSNVYTINDTVFWKSWGNNVKYSKFPANVVLSLTEQEQKLQDKVRLDSEKMKVVSLKEDAQNQVK